MLDPILALVAEQAEDDGIWFEARYITEAYLQSEIRRLHAVIEEAAGGMAATSTERKVVGE